MATYHAKAYIKATSISSTSISVRMYGLAEDYTNTDRKVFYVLNGDIVNTEGIALGAQVTSGASYTITRLDEGTKYEIFAFVGGIGFTIQVGGGDDSGVFNAPLEVTTLEEYGGCSITSIKRNTSQLIISVKNTGDEDYLFGIRGSTTLKSKYSTMHATSLISPSATYTFTISLTEANKNKILYIYIVQIKEDYSSDTVYPQSGGKVTVDGKEYTIHHSSSSYDTGVWEACNVIEIPAPIVYSVTFNHIYNDSIQETTSETIEYGETIILKDYSKTIDGYKYDYAINSDVTAVDCATITEDTFFDLYYVPIKLLSKWDWYSSNGSANATATETAYNALVNNGKVKDFSHLVWNDLCEKVENMLLAAGGSWKDTDGNEIDGSELIMPYLNNDKTLYASKYNLLQWQIYRVAIQYCSENPDDTAEWTVTDADWANAIVSKGQDVEGQKHFIDLTSLLNHVIGYINTH